MTDRELFDGIREEFNRIPSEDELNFVIEWLYDCTFEDICTLDFLEMIDRIDDALSAHDVELTG